jgi:acyl-CoA synthetase (AMP-forming)/AMP-acid ligase II
MVVLPFFYSYGNSLLTTHIKIGGTLVINNRFLFPNVVLENMIAEEVTGFAGVPSSFSILINKSSIRKYHFPNLRYVTQAGGAMPPQMIAEFLNIIPDVQFYVMYGQTEASARLTYLDPNYLKEKTGSIGKAIPGVELIVENKSGAPVKPGKAGKTGEAGEIKAKGDNVMIGYWNSPDETALTIKDGWLCTGDLARIDGDGFIYIVDRKKNIIKSGANRISPIEIENVVLQIPGVQECAAVGIDDDILGEAIILFIVGDAFSIEKKDIFLYCKKNLASYKIPKMIEFVSELPKTSSGKVKRQILKDAKLSDHRC